MSSKTLAKLKQSVVDGDFYSALQLYKTQYSRALKKKEYKKAIDVSKNGTINLLEYKEASAGTELASLYIEALTESNTNCDDDVSNSFIQIDDLYNKCLENKELTNEKKNEIFRDKAKILSKSIEYSSKYGLYPGGHPDLNKRSAAANVKIGNLVAANNNFVFAEDPENFAKFLVNWAQVGTKSNADNTNDPLLAHSNRDLYIARAVFQLLCVENVRDANKIYAIFVKQTNIDTPLIRFLGFLLKTVQRDAAPLYKMLLQKYDTTLKRGNFLKPTSFNQYLMKIGEIYFNMRPKMQGNNQMNNIMNSFMQMMNQ